MLDCKREPGTVAGAPRRFSAAATPSGSLQPITDRPGPTLHNTQLMGVSGLALHARFREPHCRESIFGWKTMPSNKNIPVLQRFGLAANCVNQMCCKPPESLSSTSSYLVQCSLRNIEMTPGPFEMPNTPFQPSSSTMFPHSPCIKTVRQAMRGTLERVTTHPERRTEPAFQ